MHRNLVPLLLLITPLVTAQSPPDHHVKSLKIRVLSTMLTADEGIGEWGFSALVEVDGRRILFDTGARPGTVFNNAKDWSFFRELSAGASRRWLRRWIRPR